AQLMSSQVVESSGVSKQQGATRTQLVQRLMAASDNLGQFLHDLLTTQAVSVLGTEAAAFIIERRDEKQFNLRPMAHLRPDTSSEEVRTAAMEAFKELVIPCIEQNKDGAVEISPPGHVGETQFCLITLLKSEGKSVAV